MKLLENRILRDARVLSDDILDVDSFLGCQTDPVFIRELAEEFYRRFEDCGVTKVLSAGPYGSVPASFAALIFEKPLLIALRSGFGFSGKGVYTGKVVSFTYSEVYDLSVPREFLLRSDRVLILSDVLSRGSEISGLVEIVKQSGAQLCGVGVVIEKAYLNGAKKLRGSGIRVEALARIESMSSANGIRFISE